MMNAFIAINGYGPCSTYGKTNSPNAVSAAC